MRNDQTRSRAIALLNEYNRDVSPSTGFWPSGSLLAANVGKSPVEVSAKLLTAKIRFFICSKVYYS